MPDAVSDAGTVRTIGAVVGLVLLVVLGLGMVLLVLSASNRTSWTDLKIGMCIDLSAPLQEGDVEALYAVDVVSCPGPLDSEEVVGEVIDVGDLNPGASAPYPSEDDLVATVDAICASLAYDRDRFGVLPIMPDERTWVDRGGRYVCLAVAYGG